MKRHVQGSFAVGLFLVIALLASTAVPGYAQRGGGGSHGGGGAPGGGAHGGGAGAHGGGWHGGGGGWHGGGGAWRGGGGGWHGGGWHGGGGGWRGGWWGPGVFIGAGLAASPWWYPYYGYPYPYAYPYPYGYPAYSPPVMAESSPQTYIQQEPPAQQYWYYCQSPQGYYPYVSECPGGWQQVAPQPPPPPR